MNDREFLKLKEYAKERLKDSYDLFDVEHEVDRTLNYEENKNIIEEKLQSIIPSEEDVKDLKEDELKFEKQGKEFIEKEREKIMEKEGRINIFEEQANVLVVGRKRAGKSCIGWAWAKSFSECGREFYIYRHPRPEELNNLPFKVKDITNLKQVSNLRNAVILIDEADKQFPVLEKAVNSQLRNILSLSGQNNICFIFVCHNSFFINRSLFSFIDIKIIKEVNENHWELERPFMKKLYENVCVMGNDRFFIDSDYMRGLETFNKPEWFTDKLSFAYRNESKEDFFTKMRGNASKPTKRGRFAEKCGEKTIPIK